MSVYIVHPPGASTFKFGVASDFAFRNVHRTCHAVFNYHVFPCADAHTVEEKLKSALEARGCLLKHMTPARFSECTNVGDDESHLWFALKFLAAITKTPRHKVTKVETIKETEEIEVDLNNEQCAENMECDCEEVVVIVDEDDNDNEDEDDDDFKRGTKCRRVLRDKDNGESNCEEVCTDRVPSLPSFIASLLNSRGTDAACAAALRETAFPNNPLQYVFLGRRRGGWYASTGKDREEWQRMEDPLFHFSILIATKLVPLLKSSKECNLFSHLDDARKKVLKKLESNSAKKHVMRELSILCKATPETTERVLQNLKH